MNANTQALKEQLESLPNLNFFFYPSRAKRFTNGFSFDFPNPSDFRVGIIVDPCKYTNYDCCNNVFGTPEYGIEQPYINQSFKI